MLVCGRALIPLLIISLLNHSFVTSFKNGTRPRFHPSGDSKDYYSEYEDISTEPPSSSLTEDPESNLCLYDMCVEQQRSCRDLALATGCLCPGLTGSQTPPGPPHLLKLSQEDGKGIVVYWCAPTSIVTHYIVWVKGKYKVMDRKLLVEERKRTAVLGDVAADVHVCIEAVNNAGVSEHDSQSCTMFEPQTSDGLALKLGIIGGVVGLLVLLILALLLWRHKKRQKLTAHGKEKSETVL